MIYYHLSDIVMNHYYYYWMCNSANLIDNYKSKYDDIYREIENLRRENDPINDNENRIDERAGERY